jgi:hypothetical protein
LTIEKSTNSFPNNTPLNGTIDRESDLVHVYYARKAPSGVGALLPVLK